MRLIKIINVSILILSFLSCTENNSNQGDKSEEESKTNILFIFANDWGWGDLSAHGHPYVKTLNIDRLIAEGTDFQRFTVASGVCSPSSTAVMTGQFPARYNIDGHFAWVPQNAKRNMPDWLDYETTLVIFSSDNGPARAASPAELKSYLDTATGLGYNIAGSKGITGGRKAYI